MRKSELTRDSEHIKYLNNREMKRYKNFKVVLSSSFLVPSLSFKPRKRRTPVIKNLKKKILLNRCQVREKIAVVWTD